MVLVSITLLDALRVANNDMLSRLRYELLVPYNAYSSLEKSTYANALIRDFPLDPSNYSYVDAANKAGYTTFAIDRLGVGGSSKPDPIEAVQLASHIEIVKLLTERLREGTTGFSNVGKFEKVIHVGHSC